jgi:hypothetical protein
MFPMKKLFVLALVCLGPLAWTTTAATTAKAKHKSKRGDASTPAAVAVPVTPAAPLPRKPGFWERAWVGTKAGSKKVWSATSRTVARPFAGKGAKAAGKGGWRELSMTLAIEPATIKLPDTHSLRVKVSVVNHGKNGVQLEFPSPERVAVLILDDAGKVRARSAAEQKGDPEQGLLIINPEERLEYTATVPTGTLSAGQSYTVEAIFPEFPELKAHHPIAPIR